jgi:hypothetical protein
MDFKSSVPIGRWQPELVSPATVIGTAGRRVSFSGEKVSGPTVTRRGVPEGRLSVEYYGAAQGVGGNATVWIILDTSEGRFRYEATGSLTNVKESEDGVVEYTFTGTYAPIEWPMAEDGSALVTVDAPHHGTFHLDLRFWQDRTSLYEVGLALWESRS